MRAVCVAASGLFNRIINHLMDRVRRGNCPLRVQDYADDTALFNSSPIPQRPEDVEKKKLQTMEVRSSLCWISVTPISHLWSTITNNDSLTPEINWHRTLVAGVMHTQKATKATSLHLQSHKTDL